MSITMTNQRVEVRLKQDLAREQYRVPRLSAPIDLRLDANEGPAWAVEAGIALDESLTRLYPDASELERLLAERLGIERERVVVTAGGDDAIDRVCRSVLEAGTEVVFPVPSFEMIRRSAELAGAKVVAVEWKPGEAWPEEAVCDAVNERTRLIAIVSPNNPTGQVVPREVIERIAVRFPSVLVLLDLAYTEFADEDLTEAGLGLENVVVIRTFSKAWSLAGGRVGYAAGARRVIGALRVCGSPYPVSGVTLKVAAERVRSGAEMMRRSVARVQGERRELTEVLKRLGVWCAPSEANFVFARFERSEFVWRGLSAMGIAVRRFEGSPGDALNGCLRITCPGDAAAFMRLRDALEVILSPQALLFDMDGVLADTSASYTQAIIRTAGTYGVTVTERELMDVIAAGDSNNDWVVTQRLLQRAGVEAGLDEVTSRFERMYQGDESTAGLRETEELIPSRTVLEGLASRMKLGIVTGRPRRDAEWFLKRHGLEGLFGAMVCMNEAPRRKPDPAPVKLAMERLGVTRAWMIGDTPDDARAARNAGVLALGVIAPGVDGTLMGPVLESIGVAAVMRTVDEIKELVP